MSPKFPILVTFALVAAATAVRAQPAAPTTAEAPASQPATQATGLNIEGLEEATDLLELKVPTVVTASRREQPITGVPYAISIITQEDMRRAGARSIPDALRLVPGVDVADLTSNSWAASPRGVHGLLSNQTLVLVDGRQIYDPLCGGTLWGTWPFRMEDIERIEVLRGPAGVTWGANAMNGVINIITKDPADQQGLTIRGGGGSRGFQNEYLGYGLEDGNLRFRVSGEHNGSDGFLRGGSLIRSLDDGFHNGHMGVYAIYDAGKSDRLAFSGGSAVQDGGLPTTPAAGLFGAGHQGAQANFVMGKWTHQVEKSNSLELIGFVNDFYTSPGLKSFDYRYQQYALQLRHSFRPAEAHTGSWGIDTRGDFVDGGGADPYMMRQSRVATGIFGAYVQDEWQLAPRWTLSLGGRVDYETEGYVRPSGRVSLSHQLTTNVAVYGAVSHAFHSLSGATRFLRAPLLDGLAGLTSNPDISPSTAMSYEVGARGRFFEKLDLNANFFWEDFDEVYTFQPRLGPPGLVRFNLDNNAEAGIYGAELEARYALTKSLTLLGNYTYEQMEWGSSGGIWQKDSMTPPKHKFMVGTRYDPIPDLHLSSHLYFVDWVEAPTPAFPFVSTDIDRYYRLDLQAEYEFWDKKASVAVGVRNLLDDNHPEGTTLFLNNAEVPRLIYAELRVRLP